MLLDKQQILCCYYLTMKVMTAQRGMTMKEVKEYIRTVTTKGQVTISAEIRRLLEVEPGDKVVFRVREGTIEVL